MAKVFLDTNAFIDLWIPARTPNLSPLGKHDIFISPLSIHIYAYTYKIKIPTRELNLERRFYFTDFNKQIVLQSLKGPTKDFEDNVQLHSAAQAKADFFLTSDKKLLNLKSFGRTVIRSSLQTN